jgi:hypothetical protein
MPAFGLGKVVSRIPAEGRLETAAGRLAVGAEVSGRAETTAVA